jgi:hypothetical protein
MVFLLLIFVLFSGLDHLIGSPLLRAHMHGYYMDVRLYRKAVSGLWQTFPVFRISRIRTYVRVTDPDPDSSIVKQ